MDNPHKRKKQPELVRQALLDQAAKLAVQGGLAAVTVQAVSEAAGVTKGGFMHHFACKQALVDTVFDGMKTIIDEDIDARMAADPEPYGSFTRAFIESVFFFGQTSECPWAALSVTILSDPTLRTRWADSFYQRAARHHATDGDIKLTTIRLAADGIWLAGMAGIELPEKDKLRSYLLEATRKPKEP